MRRLVLLMVGLTVGFWLSATWTSSAVSADTPVLVLAADDVILRLPAAILPCLLLRIDGSVGTLGRSMQDEKW